MRYTKGKTVYWVNWQRFENSKDKRDGRAKAEAYCLDNFINPADIQRFDSRTEATRYECLLKQAQLGIIDNLAHHFTLKIQDEFINSNGDLIPAITYEADFIYRIVASGQRIVEDVKGSEFFIDERFITLKQVFDAKMREKGLYIKVVLYRNQDWIEWHIGEKKKSQKLIKKQRDELRMLKQAQHERDMREKKETRERARIKELRDLRDKGVNLSRSQTKRLEELENKYAI
jgi:hypothetical protein